MMISPETYYEMNLQGKSPKEIMKKIRSLKIQIGQLKRSIEKTDDMVLEVFPGRLTRLKCDQDYLERAIQAYEEAGGEYVRSKAEQKDHDFNEALDSMSKLVFTIGGFFCGHETRTFTVSDDQVLMDVEKTVMTMDKGEEYGPYRKDDFISGIKAFHIGEWKRTYNDPLILDGTQWELDIYYNNGRRSTKISGSNAYPYNFDDLKEYLEVEMEDEEDEQNQD